MTKRHKNANHWTSKPKRKKPAKITNLARYAHERISKDEFLEYSTTNSTHITSEEPFWMYSPADKKHFRCWPKPNAFSWKQQTHQNEKYTNVDRGKSERRTQVRPMWSLKSNWRQVEKSSRFAETWNAQCAQHFRMLPFSDTFWLKKKANEPQLTASTHKCRAKKLISRREHRKRLCEMKRLLNFQMLGC